MSVNNKSPSPKMSGVKTVDEHQQQDHHQSEKLLLHEQSSSSTSSSLLSANKIGRICHVIKRKNFDGYGFNLHAEKGKPGQYIGKVDEKSPAEEAGLKHGDRIIEVNGVNIGNETHKQVVERIKTISNEVQLYVVNHDCPVDKNNKISFNFINQKSISPTMQIKTINNNNNNNNNNINDDPDNDGDDDDDDYDDDDDNNIIKKNINIPSSSKSLSSNCSSISNSNSIINDNNKLSDININNNINNNNINNQLNDEIKLNDNLKLMDEQLIKNKNQTKIIDNNVNDNNKTEKPLIVNNNNDNNNDNNDNDNINKKISLPLTSLTNKTIKCEKTNDDVNEITDEIGLSSTINNESTLIKKLTNIDTKSSVSSLTTTSSSITETITSDKNSRITTTLQITNNNNNNNENNIGHLNLHMTAAELRAKLAAKKKYDPKNDLVDLKKKFDILQKL